MRQFVIIIALKYCMNCMQDMKEEQQLLQGVTMTKSISCPNQDFNVENIVISETDEIQSIHHNSGFFQQSSNQAQYVYVSKVDHFSVDNNLKQTCKPKFPNQKVFHQNTAITGKTMKTVLELDKNLAEMHFNRILEKSSCMIQQMNQIVLTQEYLQLKSYERQLLLIIKDLQFTFAQFQKQKKSFINQIHCLKNDNENLNQTINRLQSFIENIYTFCEEKTARKVKENQKSKDQMTNVPFAGTFCHSLDELLNQNMQQDHKNFISITQFEQLIYKINKTIKDSMNSNRITLKDLNFFEIIPYKFRISGLMNDLQDTLKYLFEKTRPNNKQVSKNTNYDKSNMRIIQIFLNSISQNRQKLIKNINNHADRQLSLYYAVHSQVVTFLGILINETKELSLQISFGDNSNAWMNIFIEEIRQLKDKSKMNFNQDHLKYFNRIEQLIRDVNDLTIYRMLRNNA